MYLDTWGQLGWRQKTKDVWAAKIEIIKFIVPMCWWLCPLGILTESLTLPLHMIRTLFLFFLIHFLCLFLSLAALGLSQGMQGLPLGRVGSSVHGLCSLWLVGSVLAAHVPRLVKSYSLTRDGTCISEAIPIRELMKWSEVKWSEVAQLCPTLCDPMDCSLPGSSVHGILQARILEWVAISFSMNIISYQVS